MTKWHGCPIVITMIKIWLEIIWYEHKQTYPPPTYLPSPWKVISILLQIACKSNWVQLIEINYLKFI